MPPPKNNTGSRMPRGVGSKSDRKTMQWIFEKCDVSGLPRCAAFRACGYIRRMGGRGDVAERCDRLFMPKSCYPFPVRPFVVQCLFIAVKIETTDWDFTPFNEVAKRHILCLRLTKGTPALDLRELEFEIADALDWKLVPTSPFLVLSESAVPPRMLARASGLLKTAIVAGLCGTGSDDDAGAEVVAMASIVAGEVIDAGGMYGGEAETLRCARAMVACVERDRLDCVEQVSELAERMEAAKCANEAASPRHRKRRRDESADSPSSVIADGGAGGAELAKITHA